MSGDLHGHRCAKCGKRWYDERQNRGDCPRCGSEPVGRGRRPIEASAPGSTPSDAELALRAFRAQGKRLKSGGLSDAQRRWRDTFANRHGVSGTASYEWD